MVPTFSVTGEHGHVSGLVHLCASLFSQREMTKCVHQ